MWKEKRYGSENKKTDSFINTGAYGNILAAGIYGVEVNICTGNQCGAGRTGDGRA